MSDNETNERGALSAARLAEMRDTIAHGYYTGDEEDAYWDLRDLLAEYDRLRVELTAAREREAVTSIGGCKGV